MDPVAVGFAVLFLAWLILTVASQVPGSTLAVWITSRDPYGFIPQWTFFAPHPGTSDQFLLYRFKRAAGWERWTPISCAPRRSALAAVWNPEKRRLKALYDMTQLLAQSMQAQQQHPRTVCLTTPYVALLTVVVHQARQDPAAVACEFAIATIDARDPAARAQLVLRSEVHRIDRVPDLAHAGAV